ncbi:hypothetical protein C0J52_26073 [Blattella germanica]|nr:hypothetical protein C0J52_26073 [Blattella germanica]
MHTVRDLDARLECHFDLEGEALYSVKWYKDGNEFFRYVPRDHPPIQLFFLPGVSVDVSSGYILCITCIHISFGSEVLWMIVYSPNPVETVISKYENVIQFRSLQRKIFFRR